MPCKIKKVKARVTGSSLIGVGEERPTSWGNYFNLKEGRVLNFWAENLETAVDRFLTDGMVNVRIYSDTNNRNFIIIDDDRIPKDWYYNKLCFTGYGRPSKEVAKEIFDHLGDPTNEMEFYDDPVLYYRKRNQDYNPKYGYIQCPSEWELAEDGVSWRKKSPILKPSQKMIDDYTPKRKLKDTRVIEISQEIKAFHSIDAEEELTKLIADELKKE